MHKHQLAIGGLLTALLAAAIVAGCGGGGASSALPPGGGGGHPSPTPSSSPSGSPSPSPSPSVSPSPGGSATPAEVLGQMNYAIGGSNPSPTLTPAVHAEVDVTCGCSAEAGTGFTSNLPNPGSYDLTTFSTPVPASPSPYQLFPGRNYMVISTQTQSGNKAQTWTIVFAGNDRTRDQYLAGSGQITSDTVTAAVALWVYGNSIANADAFDDWNFVTLQAFYQHLLSSPNAQETQLMNDIVTAQEAKTTMYPAKPAWRPNRIKNPTIAADIAAINTSGDAALPTPCPSGPGSCTNTPTP